MLYLKVVVDARPYPMVTALSCAFVVVMTTCLEMATCKIQKPTFFNTCRRSDLGFNDCLRSSIDAIIKNIRHGSVDLNLKSLDLLELPDFVIDEDSSEDFTLALTLTHTQLRGAGHADVTAVRSTTLDDKLELSVKYPVLELTGEYVSEGAVLVFPLASNGRFVVNMTDVTALWMIYLNREVENATGVIAVDELRMDLTPAAVYYHFGDALDGDVDLGEAMNELLNANAHEVFKAMLFKTRPIFEAEFKRVANSFLRNYSSEMLIAD